MKSEILPAGELRVANRDFWAKQVRELAELRGRMLDRGMMDLDRQLEPMHALAVRRAVEAEKAVSNS